MRKDAQLKLSFGMIFSIILIIAFLGFGFFVVYKFIILTECVQAGDFVNDLQTDIDKIWKTSLGSNPGEYNVPSATEKICFVDFLNDPDGRDAEIYRELNMMYSGSENMMLYPQLDCDATSFEIKHINLDEITKTENPYCIDVQKGQANIMLKMNSGQTLVMVSR
tara:strand:- start:237 stop:731 length:495 start_codon:yes stop_codon:yes gene_type:complete